MDTRFFFKKGKATVTNSNREVIMTAKREDDLHYVTKLTESTYTAGVKKSSWQKLHEKFEHILGP